MVLWIKDPGWSLQGLGSLLWRSFDPWPTCCGHGRKTPPPHNIQLTVSSIFKWTYNIVALTMYMVVQQTSRTFSSDKTELSTH